MTSPRWDLGPASFLATLTPTKRKHHNERMVRTADAPSRAFTPTPKPPSTSRDLAASRSSSFYSWMQHSMHSDATNFGGESAWNGRSQLLHVSAEHEMRGRDSADGPLPWTSLSRVDRLNVDLEHHPRWVVAGVAGPGTYDESHNRWNLLNKGDQGQGWSPRFIVEHVLDGNAVHNGMRTLSPARRRHNGGVGFDHPDGQ